MGKARHSSFTRYFRIRLNKLLNECHYTHKELADKSGVEENEDEPKT